MNTRLEATLAPVQLQALCATLIAAAAHPFVPSPVREALPQLAAVLEHQQRQIDALCGVLFPSADEAPSEAVQGQQGQDLSDPAQL